MRRGLGAVDDSVRIVVAMEVGKGESRELTVFGFESEIDKDARCCEPIRHLFKGMGVGELKDSVTDLGLLSESVHKGFRIQPPDIGVGDGNIPALIFVVSDTTALTLGIGSLVPTFITVNV